MSALACEGLRPAEHVRRMRNTDLLVAWALIACQPFRCWLIPCCYMTGDGAEITGHMPDVDTLREPQRHQPYAEVPAPVPRPWPTRPVPLRATVAGAGRIMDLDEFLAVTVSMNGRTLMTCMRLKASAGCANALMRQSMWETPPQSRMKKVSWKPS